MFRTDVQPSIRPHRITSGLPGGCDVAVLGGGMAGMATALRLQAAGLSTVVFEAHGHVGGCAGYFRHKGFSFDVGATTLVDFEPGGVGAELLDAVGLPALDGEPLPGYVVWLPDRAVTLHRDRRAWQHERLRALGGSRNHREFWALMDRLADAFWVASRSGIRLPVRRAADLVCDVRAIGLRQLPLARYLGETLGGALCRFGLRDDAALVGLLAMLVEDTVHSSVDRAPLINAALGVTIRGAGLTRHRGGMHGFWRQMVAHYRAVGGTLRAGCRVERVTGHASGYRVHTARGSIDAGQVVSALPAASTARIAAATPVARRLLPYLRRDAPDLGGAVVVFLGVPQDEVADQPLTHHQVLQDFARPLGDGNNMFVSVSSSGDLVSAPAGHRAVMISTHTELAAWNGLSETEYQKRKHEIGERLVGYARRAYPRLAERAVVRQVGTPRTYERFAFRPSGAVGGVRQTLANTNQRAIPHNLGVKGFWLVGDSTWPGLGTVACVLGSRIVANGVRRAASRRRSTKVGVSR
jgi:C-3',4' desaturase CrtD